MWLPSGTQVFRNVKQKIQVKTPSIWILKFHRGVLYLFCTCKRIYFLVPYIRKAQVKQPSCNHHLLNPQIISHERNPGSLERWRSRSGSRNARDELRTSQSWPSECHPKDRASLKPPLVRDRKLMRAIAQSTSHVPRVLPNNGNVCVLVMSGRCRAPAHCSQSWFIKRNQGLSLFV